MTRPSAFFFSLLGFAAFCPRASGAWPVIRPVHESHTYTVGGSADTPLISFLRTTDDVPAYELECHNGNYEDMSFINSSGDFQCVLFSLDGGRRTSWNLLASDDEAEQRSDSFNRGRMTANQLWSECGQIPEYGRVRHFRLRGMRITFEFKDLHWLSPSATSQHRLRSFTFVLDVSPDANAHSATAQKPESPWPVPPCR